MTDQTINSATTIVTKAEDKVKSTVGIIPAGLIIGFGAGFLWKGLIGGIIGAVALSSGMKMYENYKNKA